jgi:CTP:molybdopterin cytidylyltransferase MocA
VTAVLGHEADRVAAEALPPGVLRTDNPRHRDGMLSSILCGLAAAESAGADAVLLHPVDHPLVSPATVDRVLEALAAGAVIAIPTHGGRRGHPGGFARAAWPALRAAPPERGARAVLASNPGWVVHVEGDPGCVAGIDTPGDYERLTGRPLR